MPPEPVVADDPASTPGAASPARDPQADAGDAVRSHEVLQVIPVIAETLEVGRRELHGAVRIRKRVVESLVHVDETMREEHVTIERVPVGRPVEGPVGIRHEGDVTIVPVLEERLVAERRLVLVEELRIRREVRTRRVPQQVPLRQELVEVERLDPRTQAWSPVDVPTAAAPSTPADTGPAGEPAGPASATPEPAATADSIPAATGAIPR